MSEPIDGSRSVSGAKNGRGANGRGAENGRVSNNGQEAKSIDLDYFAIFREVRKKDRETVSTSAATLGELYAELRERHRFSLPHEAVRVAVNDEFASWESALSDGDRVTFIPPVAGG